MMDVLDRVRQIDVHDEVDDSQLRRSRASLEELMASERQPRARRRAWALPVGIGAGALAATAAVALVVASWQPRTSDPIAGTDTPAPVETVDPRPTPTEEPATAATVLEGAARLAPASVGSAIAMGGYLRIDTRLEQLVLYSADAPDSPYNASRAGATAGWVVARTYTTYIPADRSQEWVRVFHPDFALVSTFGADAESLYAQWISGIPQEELVDRSMGGLGGEASQGVDGTIYASDAYFASMPRDPHALLTWYSARITRDDPTPNATLFTHVVQDLELNAAPADLRATMFRAIALIPGVTIAGAEGTVVTLAIEYPNDDGLWRNTISVDSATGLVAASAVTQGASPGVVPESVPSHRTTTAITASATAP